MQPPSPSPVPLPRGLYKRDDPDFPDMVIAELWTSDEQNVGCGRFRRALYEALWKKALAAALDDVDPPEPRLKLLK